MNASQTLSTPTPPEESPKNQKTRQDDELPVCSPRESLLKSHFGPRKTGLLGCLGWINQIHHPYVSFRKSSSPNNPPLTRDKNVNTHVQIPFFGGPFGLLTTQTTRNGGKKVRSQVLGWTNPPFPQTLHIYQPSFFHITCLQFQTLYISVLVNGKHPFPQYIRPFFNSDTLQY